MEQPITTREIKLTARVQVLELLLLQVIVLLARNEDVGARMGDV
jgi:hypothetical protein